MEKIFLIASFFTNLALAVIDGEKVHQSLLTLDTHVDLNLKAMQVNRHLGHNIAENQVDFPKMKKGGLKAAFFIVYQGQSVRSPKEVENAYQRSIEMFEAIDRVIKINSQDIALALTAQEVWQIQEAGKLVALIGVENAYPLGLDITQINRRVDEFYQRGARYISLTHNGHSQFADSNTSYHNEPENIHGGLSELGRYLVKKLNETGIMIDISHAHKKSTLEAIKLSKTPVIASHSAARALRDHSRNLDDEELLALKKNKGVIQVVALRSYIAEPPKEMQLAQENLMKKFNLPSGNNTWLVLKMRPTTEQNQFNDQWQKIQNQYHYAGVVNFVDHIDYIVKKIGIDHVGIASDFDGGGGIDGWSNAAETKNITKELIRRGYNQEQIQKIWGKNLLRVMKAVENYALDLKKKS